MKKAQKIACCETFRLVQLRKFDNKRRLLLPQIYTDSLRMIHKRMPTEKDTGDFFGHITLMLH